MTLAMTAVSSLLVARSRSGMRTLVREASWAPTSTWAACKKAASRSGHAPCLGSDTVIVSGKRGGCLRQALVRLRAPAPECRELRVLARACMESTVSERARIIGWAVGEKLRGREKCGR
jgi:hypothetical protein